MTARVSLSLLVHRLLSCSQAEQSRGFLCNNADVRSLLFAKLQSAGGFGTDSVKQGAADPQLVRLIACLALQTVTAGPAAQAKLVRHVCCYSSAYLTLLLPHWRDDRVASLLSLLAGWGAADDAVQQEGGGAQAYLQLLTALVHGVTRGEGGAAGGGAADGSAGSSLPPALAELLAAACSSIPATVAALEVDARQAVSAKQQGRKSKQPSPAQAEEAVRAALPTGVIANAIATVGGLAPFIPELLQHHHRHCMPLLVGMLQVELLTARLPPPKQRPLEVLGRLLQHGHVLGCGLHASLTGVLSGGRACDVQLLQLVSTAKAALRCAQVAAASGLEPAGAEPGAEELQRFASASVLWRPDGGGSGSNAELLWQLVMMRSPCSPAARKACDVLQCLLGQPALAGAAVAASQVAVVAADLEAALVAPYSSHMAAPSPFCLEIGAALLSAGPELAARCPAGQLQRLADLVAEMERRRQQTAASAAAAPNAALLGSVRKGTGGNLDALDGLPSTGLLPASAEQQQPRSPPAPSTPPAAGAQQAGVQGASAAEKQRKLEQLKMILAAKQAKAAAAAAAAAAAVAQEQPLQAASAPLQVPAPACRHVTVQRVEVEPPAAAAAAVTGGSFHFDKQLGRLEQRGGRAGIAEGGALLVRRRATPAEREAAERKLLELQSNSLDSFAAAAAAAAAGAGSAYSAPAASLLPADQQQPGRRHSSDIVHTPSPVQAAARGDAHAAPAAVFGLCSWAASAPALFVPPVPAAQAAAGAPSLSAEPTAGMQFSLHSGMHGGAADMDTDSGLAAMEE